MIFHYPFGDSVDKIMVDFRSIFFSEESTMSDKYSTVEQRVSYGIGRQMGDQLASNSFDGVDVDAVAEGLKDALNGIPSVVETGLLREAFEEIT